MVLISSEELAVSGAASPDRAATGVVGHGPRMRSMELLRNSVLTRISSRICEDTCRLHSFDFERAQHRSEASILLRKTLIDLRERITRRPAISLAPAGDEFLLACRAS